VFERPFFDPTCTLLIAGFFVFSTIREIVASREELMWPGG